MIPHADRMRELTKDDRARGTLDGLSHTHKREYAPWIEDARRQDTRRGRLQKAVGRLKQGRRGR